MLEISSLFDPEIVSDFRATPIPEGFLVKVKRSKYVTKIPAEPSCEAAYLGGAIAGDGCFKKSSRKNTKYPRIAIAITNKSKRYLELLNRLFLECFAYSGQIVKRKDKDYYDLLVSNRIIWLYFRNGIGLPQDKSRLALPKMFERGKLCRNFIAGLFDTDGYFSGGTFGIMLEGKNYPFLCQIKRAAGEQGIIFGKISRNTLVVGKKKFHRTIMRLRTMSVGAFWTRVPLRHDKYGPGEDRTPGFHRVRVTRSKKRQKRLLAP